MILEHLGIYGWKEQDENLVMASLVKGGLVALDQQTRVCQSAKPRLTRAARRE